MITTLSTNGEGMSSPPPPHLYTPWLLTEKCLHWWSFSLVIQNYYHVWSNQMGTVFVNMSLDSFYLKSRNEDSILDQIYIFQIFSDTQTITFENLNLYCKDPGHLLFIIWSKMLSSSLDSMLTLFTATSPQKLFHSDCITLYHFVEFWILDSFFFF